MKLIYIANIRLPTEKAHGIQTMKTCEALVKLGADLELWVPKRRNPEFFNRDPFEFYNLAERFPIRYLSCLDLVGRLNFFPGAGFYIESKTFARSVAKNLKDCDFKKTVFYSRDTYPLEPIRKAKGSYFYEAHTVSPSPSRLQLGIYQKAAGIVCISKHLAQEFQKYLPEEKIGVAQDGVDLEGFSGNIDRKAARLQLGWPQDQKIVLYAGHLYQWKGAELLAQSTTFLPKNAWAYFVGGTTEDLKAFQQFVLNSRLDRIKVIGYVPHFEVPIYLAAADVLVLPNSAKYEISYSHTSPLKLFEYMASRRPIAASDLPSLREVLDEATSVLFTPDDPVSLAKKIQVLLDDPSLVERITANALRKVRGYTWEVRAKKILIFIQNRLSYTGPSSPLW